MVCFVCYGWCCWGNGFYGMLLYVFLFEWDCLGDVCCDLCVGLLEVFGVVCYDGYVDVVVCVVVLGFVVWEYLFVLLKDCWDFVVLKVDSVVWMYLGCGGEGYGWDYVWGVGWVDYVVCV